MLVFFVQRQLNYFFAANLNRHGVKHCYLASHQVGFNTGGSGSVEECPKEVEMPRPGSCEDAPDLLARLLQQLGGEAAFGEVVQDESTFNQLDDPYLLTPSSNCDFLLDLVDGDSVKW